MSKPLSEQILLSALGKAHDDEWRRGPADVSLRCVSSASSRESIAASFASATALTTAAAAALSDNAKGPALESILNANTGPDATVHSSVTVLRKTDDDLRGTCPETKEMECPSDRCENLEQVDASSDVKDYIAVGSSSSQRLPTSLSYSASIVTRTGTEYNARLPGPSHVQEHDREWRHHDGGDVEMGADMDVNVNLAVLDGTHLDIDPKVKPGKQSIAVSFLTSSSSDAVSYVEESQKVHRLPPPLPAQTIPPAETASGGRKIHSSTVLDSLSTATASSSGASTRKKTFSKKDEEIGDASVTVGAMNASSTYDALPFALTPTTRPPIFSSLAHALSFPSAFQGGPSSNDAAVRSQSSVAQRLNFLSAAGHNLHRGFTHTMNSISAGSLSSGPATSLMEVDRLPPPRTLPSNDRPWTVMPKEREEFIKDHYPGDSSHNGSERVGKSDGNDDIGGAMSTEELVAASPKHAPVSRQMTSSSSSSTTLHVAEVHSMPPETVKDAADDGGDKSADEELLSPTSLASPDNAGSGPGGTGVASYACPWQGCKKTFSRYFNLRSHYRIHSGEKPFLCAECQLPFARNHDLKRHMRIHTGAKPYTCPWCQKSFSRNDAMSRHVKLASCLNKVNPSQTPPQPDQEYREYHPSPPEQMRHSPYDLLMHPSLSSALSSPLAHPGRLSNRPLHSEPSGSLPDNAHLQHQFAHSHPRLQPPLYHELLASSVGPSSHSSLPSLSAVGGGRLASSSSASSSSSTAVVAARSSSYVLTPPPMLPNTLSRTSPTTFSLPHPVSNTYMMPSNVSTSRSTNSTSSTAAMASAPAASMYTFSHTFDRAGAAASGAYHGHRVATFLPPLTSGQTPYAPCTAFAPHPYGRSLPLPGSFALPPLSASSVPGVGPGQSYGVGAGGGVHFRLSPPSSPSYRSISPSALSSTPRPVSPTSQAMSFLSHPFHLPNKMQGYKDLTAPLSPLHSVHRALPATYHPHAD